MMPALSELTEQSELTLLNKLWRVHLGRFSITHLCSKECGGKKGRCGEECRSS